MKRAAYPLLVLLVAGLYVYFFGTPLMSRLTGVAPRTISLLAGLVVVISAIVAMMLGRLAATRRRKEMPDIDSRR
jgi:biotin transporter BioY